MEVGQRVTRRSKKKWRRVMKLDWHVAVFFVDVTKRHFKPDVKIDLDRRRNRWPSGEGFVFADNENYTVAVICQRFKDGGEIELVILDKASVLHV